MRPLADKRARKPQSGLASGEQPRILVELLQFPARHLRELPVATRIHLQVAGWDTEIVLTSSAGPAPTEAIHFDGDEVRALAIGVEAERLFAADFKGYCLLKLHDRSFRISAEHTLSGAMPAVTSAWSLERVLRALELEPRSAELGDELPARPGVAVEPRRRRAVAA